MKHPQLSVIVPVYNESKRVHHLKTIHSYLMKQTYTWELIVVNDGSTDDTLEKLHQLSKELKLTPISYSPNQGKGQAIKTGMIASKGDYALFLDVDLSTPIETLDHFWPQRDTAPVLIGTRKIAASNVDVHQPWLREQLGKCFTWLSRTILQVPVSDFTCGFKMFSRQAVNTIFPRMTIDRWGFDSEIIFLASIHHFTIKELPVTWKNDSATKVRFPQDIINSLRDLYTIWSNHHLHHRYN